MIRVPDIEDDSSTVTQASGQWRRMQGAAVRPFMPVALDLSERRFRSLIENTTDLLTVLGASGEILYISPSIQRMGGFLPAEVVGLNFTAFVHPDDLVAAQAALRALIEHPRELRPSQMRFRHKSGSYVILDAVARNLLDDPAVNGIVINAHDVTEREQARVQSARRERYFRKLIEGSGDVFYVIDAKGTVLYRSPTATQLTGWTDAEMLGQGITRYIPLEHLPAAQHAIAETIRDPEHAARIELSLLHKNGTRLEVEATGRNLLGDPDVAGIVITARDVSERGRYQRELQFKNLMLTTQQETSIDGILVVDEDGKILSFNRRFIELWGVPDDVIETRSDERALETVLSKLNNPDEFIRRVKHLYEHKDERSNEEIELKDGRVFERYSAPMIGAAGRYYGRVWYFRDATERRRGERALSASEARYRAMFDEAAVGMTQVSLDGVFTRVNPMLCSMLGYSESELIGRKFADLTHPDDRAQSEAARRALLASPGRAPGGSPFEKRYLRKDGGTLWANVSVAAVRGAEGTPGCFVTVVQDITERKKAQLQLQLFRALIDDANDDVMVLDPATFRVLDANERSCANLGYTRAELLALMSADIDSAVADPKDAARIHADLDRTGTAAFESVRRRKDGSTYPVEVIERLTRVDRPYLIAIGRDVTERRKADDRLKNVNRVLKTLSAGSEALVRAPDESTLMSDMCRTLVEVGEYRRAWIALFQSDSSAQPAMARSWGEGPDLLADIIAGWATTPAGRGLAAPGESWIIQDVADDPCVHAESARLLAAGVQSVAAFPLTLSDRSLGIMIIAGSQPGIFGLEEVALLQQLAGDVQYGLAALRDRAERERAAKRLRQSMESAVAALAAMAESRDPYTAGHQHRAADLAVAIARELGFDEMRARGVHLAAVVHDIGKIQVPAELLSKPGHLSAIEFQLIQTHVQAGYDILKNIDFPWPVAEFVLQHHERMNGTGYPNGLKGAQIHLESKIISVADVVEAMGSHRPYRPARPAEMALLQIEAGRGELYDPAVVDACVRLFKEGRFSFAEDTWTATARPAGSSADCAAGAATAARPADESEPPRGE